MTTPIIMLVLLCAPYLIARLMSALTGREFDLSVAGALGLTLVFIFTGIGHFTQTEPMAQMLPAWVPARVPLIYLTGIFEFALAAGFVMRRTRRATGWLAAAMLILFFPANVYAALNRIPMGGHEWGLSYLLIRAPLQAILLLWVYWFAIKQPDRSALRANESGRH